MDVLHQRITENKPSTIYPAIYQRLKNDIYQGDMNALPIHVEIQCEHMMCEYENLEFEI